MKRAIGGCVLGGLMLTVPLASGCFNLGTGTDQPTGVAGEVASKAQQVVDQIGGPAGFGGMMMFGYADHFPWPMGFYDTDDLASVGGLMTVQLENATDLPCRFNVVYLSSLEGLDEQTLTVDVLAGQTDTVELPCAEIIGLGSLTENGETAAVLDDGALLPNTWCVPGFLHADYGCNGQFSAVVQADVDDLDGDGDTTEPIVVTESLRLHAAPGGMMGHGFMMGFPVQR